jgi:hypothetical protein
MAVSAKPQSKITSMRYRIKIQTDSKERLGPLIDKRISTATCLNCDREFYFVVEQVRSDGSLTCPFCGKTHPARIIE